MSETSQLGKSLEVHELTILKCLKVLGMFQKLGHWVLHELKPEKAKK